MRITYDKVVTRGSFPPNPCDDQLFSYFHDDTSLTSSRVSKGCILGGIYYSNRAGRRALVYLV